MNSLRHNLAVYKSYFTPSALIKILIAPAIVLVYFTGVSLLSKTDSEAASVNATYTDVVRQAVNPKTSASLLTIHSSEVQSAAKKHGFTQSQELFLASPRLAVGLVPIYRVYNASSGDFMVTQWRSEVQNAIKKYGYAYEGVAFYAAPSKNQYTTPLHKFVKGPFHRYAVTPSDVQQLERNGWQNEGVAFYVRTLAATPAHEQPTIPNQATPATPSPAPSSPTPVEPSGDVVPWQAVAQPGQDIHTVLQHPVLHGKILQLPKGVFEVTNFRDGYKAINIPPQVKGLIGSGRDTIIRLKPHSSTYGHTVPAQETRSTNQLYVLRMNDGTTPQLLADFWLQGTEQGHLYNGIMVGKSQPGTTVRGLYVTGIPGNARENPGETFGLTFWRGSHSITRSVEVDGRRIMGNSITQRVFGESVGASGLAFSTHNYAKVYDSYIHDHRHGMPTFWQSNYGETWNLQSVRNRIGINHERSFGTVHHQPVMHSAHAGYHVNFLADNGNGSLKIIGATNDEWISLTTKGSIGKNKKMMVMTSTDYTGPNTNTITTPPSIMLDDGKTPAPYFWAH